MQCFANHENERGMINCKHQVGGTSYSVQLRSQNIRKLRLQIFYHVLNYTQQTIIKHFQKCFLYAA